MIARPMLAAERRFVVPTWVRSLAAFRRIAPAGKQWRAVDRILDDPATRVHVLTTDGRTIHGWAAATGAVLQYAYVAPELRGHGYARQAITAVLDGYPDHIDIATAWPFESSRFRWETQRTAA